MPSVPDSSEFTKYQKYRAAAADYANGFAFNRRRVTYVPSPPLGAYAGFIRDSQIALSVGPVAPAPAPVAEFSADPLSGSAGVTLISFTDESTNNPTSWLWDFGDGNTSNERNPTHIYEEEGQYNVSLTATNAAGSDTETKTNYINVSGPTESDTINADTWESPVLTEGYYATDAIFTPVIIPEPDPETETTTLTINFDNIPIEYEGGVVTLGLVGAIELANATAGSYDSIAGLPEGVTVTVGQGAPGSGYIVLTFSENVNIAVLTSVVITFKQQRTINGLRLRLLPV